MVNVKDISKIVRSATETLSQHFIFAPAPEIAIDQCGATPIAYDPRSKCILFQMNSLPQDPIALRYVIGEETGHYLHHMANSSVFQQREYLRTQKIHQPELQTAFVLLYNFIELVGAYAGLVFVERTNGKLSVDKIIDKIRANVDCTISFLKQMNFQNYTYDDLKHVFGYLGATTIFMEHKDKQLKALAKISAIEGANQVADIADSLNILPK